MDGSGVERTIDFVDAPFGVDAKEVRRLAISAEIIGSSGKPEGRPFLIMHPVQVLESRVQNTMGLPGYDSTAAL